MIKDLAQSILLFEEIAFTRTKLSHGVRAWKENTKLHSAAIKLLMEKKLIIYCEKAVKHLTTHRYVKMWVKCVPESSDLIHLNEFQRSLLELKIQWHEFLPTLQQFRLWRDVVVTSELINLLQSPQYQSWVKFDLHSLTMISSRGNRDQANEQQNNSSFDDNAFNTSHGMLFNFRITPCASYMRCEAINQRVRFKKMFFENNRKFSQLQHKTRKS